jgi:CheY-like chemotaxis protein
VTDLQDLSSLNLKVLVAEDKTVNQRLIKRLLDKFGIEATIAGSGEEAVQAAAADKFDVILMDIQMPKVDGFEAARRIREAEGRSGFHTPIIATTGHSNKGYEERCRKEGMEAFVPKPISPQTLIETILSLIEGGKGGKQQRKNKDQVPT